MAALALDQGSLNDEFKVESMKDNKVCHNLN